MTDPRSRAPAPRVLRSGPDRPIVVVGSARSGTTLMQLMLHAHRRIAIPPELRFPMRLYMERAEIGPLDQVENRKKVADLIIDVPSSRTPPNATRPTFGDLGLDPDAMRRTILEEASTVGSAVGLVLEAYAASWGKPRWGIKRPNLLHNLAVVLELFPDAQIVSVIRDGRDCAASLLEMPWWPFGFEGALFNWVHSIEADTTARSVLGPDQYLAVRYEELVVDVFGQTRRLREFLGEDFDPAMLRPATIAGSAVPAYKVWHGRTHNPIDPSAIGRWKVDLTDDQQKLAEWVLGDQLRVAGYDLLHGGARPSRTALHEYEEYERTRRRELEEEQAEFARLRKVYPWPVAANLTSRQRTAELQQEPVPQE